MRLFHTNGEACSQNDSSDILSDQTTKNRGFGCCIHNSQMVKTTRNNPPLQLKNSQKYDFCIEKLNVRTEIIRDKYLQ